MAASVAIITLATSPDLAAVLRGAALLRQRGWHVQEGRHLRRQCSHTARSCEARREDLAWALSAPGIGVVWLAGALPCSPQFLPSLPLSIDRERMVIGGAEHRMLFDALSRRGLRNLVDAPTLEQLEAATGAWRACA